ncbi:MAG: hypothetical protein LN569_03470 [Rickettsia endosymbiont of Labidopullus appendiculatus]|nr:hypothetical protein [Rickettsia endosymbiont of Labidopullus appendiculatus]
MIIILISLTIIQMFLTLPSIWWLYKIRVSNNLIDNTSQRAASAYNRAKEDVTILHNKIEHLAKSTIEKESHILHTTFYLEEVEMYVKTLLNEFRSFVKASKDTK